MFHKTIHRLTRVGRHAETIPLPISTMFHAAPGASVSLNYQYARSKSNLSALTWHIARIVVEINSKPVDTAKNYEATKEEYRRKREFLDESRLKFPDVR
jgi:hypothetical protein